MRNDWREVRICEIGTVVTGRTPPGTKDQYFGGEIPFLTPTDMDGRRRVGITQRTLSHEGQKILSKVIVPHGVSVSCIGWQMGKAILIDKPVATNQQVNTIIPDRSIVDDLFLYYSLTARRSEIFNLGAGGSRTPILNKSGFESFRIQIPALTFQKRIANILGTLDDKIELNRLMNETLEAMARRLFRSWFVDFDPVHAKAAARREFPGLDNVELSRRALPNMAPEIAELFPDTFQDSPLGPIPKGWMVTSLADQISVCKGISYKGDCLTEEGRGIPMHNLNSVYEGGGYKHEGLKWYNGEYRPQHLLNPGDVIVTNTEQGFDYLLIGYPAIVPKKYGSQGLFSHHIYRIREKDADCLPTWFIYLLLRTPVFHDTVAGYSNGTTVNMLPQDGLQKPMLVRPAKELIRRFGALFTEMQEKIEEIHDDSLTLINTRDRLLPKLLSGEVNLEQ